MNTSEVKISEPAETPNVYKIINIESVAGLCIGYSCGKSIIFSADSFLEKVNIYFSCSSVRCILLPMSYDHCKTQYRNIIRVQTTKSVRCSLLFFFQQN